MDLEKFLNAYNELSSVRYCDSQRIQQIINGFISETTFYDIVSDFINSKKRIIDLCCGKPTKISQICAENPNCDFIGVDINPKFSKFYVGRNMRFYQGDVASLSDFDADGIIASHACGYLADKVVESAIRLDMPVLFLPCCYGKLNPFEQKPLSELFSRQDMVGKYHSLLRLAKREDISNRYNQDFTELTRILFNYDRLTRLEEAGRNAKIFKLSDIKQPHNLAILGE